MVVARMMVRVRRETCGSESSSMIMCDAAVASVKKRIRVACCSSDSKYSYSPGHAGGDDPISRTSGCRLRRSETKRKICSKKAVSKGKKRRNEE